MKEIIKNLMEEKDISISDVLSFIKFMWEFDNPNKVYDEKITIKALNSPMGLGSNIVRHYLNEFKIDPSKYGFNLVTLQDVNGLLLKVYVESN